jgi:DNA-binding transcriptional ArsR family regulator
MTGVDQDRALPIDPDDAFQAVSNSRRRQVLLSLAQSDGALSASDLAREIAAIENLVDPSDVTSEQRTRVYISLIQSHLETLDELGVAEYDERGKRVMATEATKPVARHIREISRSCYEPEEAE